MLNLAPDEILAHKTVRRRPWRTCQCRRNTSSESCVKHPRVNKRSGSAWTTGSYLIRQK